MTIIPLVLLCVALFQAAARSLCLPLTLLNAAFFSISIPVASLDFTHALLINSIFCLALAQFAAKRYDCMMSGFYIGLQFIAVVNYFMMLVFYSFLTEFYTQAITLYNSLNDVLIILNVAVLVGMTNGGSRLDNTAK